MIRPVLMALGVASLVGCSSSPAREQAEGLLSEAVVRVEACDYSGALTLIDSACAVAPAEVEIIQRGRVLRDSVRLTEAHQRLAESEGELAQLRPELARLRSGFVEQRSVEYDTPLRLVKPELTAERQGARSHLRAQVSPDGVLTLISVYVGARPVAHSALRVSVPGVEEAFVTPSIPADGALNYRYTDGLRHWELVTYPRETCDSLARYLVPALEAGEKPRMALLHEGREVSTLALSAEECRALGETLALHRALTRQQELESALSIYGQRIERLGR